MALPPLPSSVVVRILSFNVASTSDVANLRLLGRDFVALLPSLMRSNKDHIAAPPKKTEGKELYIPRVCGADDYWFESHLMTLGEEWRFEPQESTPYVKPLEEGYVLSCLFLEQPQRMFDDDGNPVITTATTTKPVDDEPDRKKAKVSEEDYCSMLLAYVMEISSATTKSKDISALFQQIKQDGLNLPVNHAVKRATPNFYNEETEIHSYPVLLTMEIPKECRSIKRTLAFADRTFVHLEADPNENLDCDDGPVVSPARPGYIYRALVMCEREDTMEVQLFFELATCYERGYEMETDEFSHPKVFNEVFDQFLKQTHVEGVAIVDGAVSPSFVSKLNGQITTLATKQAKKNMVDYHPHSRDIVRDLVHPALYSYVKGVSPLRADVDDIDACIFPHLESDQTTKENSDFWGRPYETSVYQWLPTYFEVSMDGQSCNILDYINNLAPREDHSDLYKSLETLFVQALPYIESVYSYVRAIRPRVRDTDELHSGEVPIPGTKLDVKHASLRGQKLQVITKIVDYELEPEESYEGVWHVEGMSHEEIVLTSLYILDRDETITGGDIEYKRGMFLDEADTIIGEIPQIRHPQLEQIVNDGLIPLGTVETRKGRLVVFPNSHVHRVGALRNVGSAIAKRRIVVFFLVNPLRRIVSTREVAPQQAYAGGKMTMKEAKEHRLELMKERKFTKQDWNVREIELCEH